MLGQQFSLGRQDDVGRLLLHLLLHQRHRDAGQVGAERLKTHEQRAIDRAEEARHALHVENVNQLIGRPVRSLRAERLIGELDQRRLIVRRLDHAVEFGLLAALRRRLQLARAAPELAGQVERLLNFERWQRTTRGRARRAASAGRSLELRR